MPKNPASGVTVSDNGLLYVAASVAVSSKIVRAGAGNSRLSSLREFQA